MAMFDKDDSNKDWVIVTILNLITIICNILLICKLLMR